MFDLLVNKKNLVCYIMYAQTYLWIMLMTLESGTISVNFSANRGRLNIWPFISYGRTPMNFSHTCFQLYINKSCNRFPITDSFNYITMSCKTMVHSSQGIWNVWVSCLQRSTKVVIRCQSNCINQISETQEIQQSCMAQYTDQRE